MSHTPLSEGSGIFADPDFGPQLFVWDPDYRSERPYFEVRNIVKNGQDFKFRVIRE